MGRLRIMISLLVVMSFVLVVAFASIRVRDWLGVKLVVCIALGLNFAALIVIATDLDPPIRLGALAYLTGGAGWLLMLYFLPTIDAFFQDRVVTPRLVAWMAPGTNPRAPQPDLAFSMIHLLAHSLISITLGTVGASVAWTLSRRHLDQNRSITQTTGQS